MNKFLIASTLIATTFLPGVAKAETTCEASAAQYQQVETGMKYSKVVSILGCEGDEMSSTGNVVAYIWTGNNGVISNLVVMTNNGKVMVKAKTNLK